MVSIDNVEVIRRYKIDGTTIIINNDYITAAEGGAGLKFTPAANVNTPAGGAFGFTAQASLDNTGTGISTGTSASITVTEVNDLPTGVADVLSNIIKNSGARTIAFAALLANDQNVPGNESGQTLSITGVSDPSGGTVSISGTDVIFTPTADYTGAAGFTYTVQDNGTTNVAADPKTGTGTVSFTVTNSSGTSGSSGPADSPKDVIISCIVDSADEVETLSDDGTAKLEIPTGAMPYVGIDPVEVTVVKLQESELAGINDPEKIGLFKVNDNGTLTFIGGRVVNGMFVVNTKGVNYDSIKTVQIKRC